MSTVFVGGWIVFMGYRLFTTGVFERAGDLKAAWGENHLELKQAAPGTIFALFGAAILAIAIYKGVSYEQTESSGVVPRIISVSADYGTPQHEEMMKMIETLIDGGDLDSDQKNQLLEWTRTKKTKIWAKEIWPSDDVTS